MSYSWPYTLYYIWCDSHRNGRWCEKCYMESKLYYWCVYNVGDILKYLSLFNNNYIHTCIPPFADPIQKCFCFTPLGIFVCFVLPLVVFYFCVCAVSAGIACCRNAKSKKAGMNVCYIFTYMLCLYRHRSHCAKT